jgi:di/tricarboxylate transporter
MRAGNVLIAIGIGVALVGLMVRLGWFSWFGNLPGDIRTEGERGSFFFPITSSIVISVVATLILNIVARLFSDR